jgi:hypothetical protein
LLPRLPGLPRPMPRAATRGVAFAGISGGAGGSGGAPRRLGRRGRRGPGRAAPLHVWGRGSPILGRGGCRTRALPAALSRAVLRNQEAVTILRTAAKRCSLGRRLGRAFAHAAKVARWCVMKGGYSRCSRQLQADRLVRAPPASRSCEPLGAGKFKVEAIPLAAKLGPKPALRPVTNPRRVATNSRRRWPQGDKNGRRADACSLTPATPFSCKTKHDFCLLHTSSHGRSHRMAHALLTVAGWAASAAGAPSPG